MVSHQPTSLNMFLQKPPAPCALLSPKLPFRKLKDMTIASFPTALNGGIPWMMTLSTPLLFKTLKLT